MGSTPTSGTILQTGQCLRAFFVVQRRESSRIANELSEASVVRVVQAGNGLGLALEPLLQIGVCGDVLGEDLDGDRAVQTGVAGFVDLAL